MSPKIPLPLLLGLGLGASSLAAPPFERVRSRGAFVAPRGRSAALPLPSTTGRPRPPRRPRPSPSSLSESAAGGAEPTRSRPRSGPLQTLLDLALSSPLWTYVLVPRARATMVSTAEANGVPWIAAREWLRGAMRADGAASREGGAEYPEYYLRPFHAYPEGNLCWDAALEQELAGRAVGARNFPANGSEGEDAFRGAFDRALDELGASIDCGGAGGKPAEKVIVDFGCGTGTSARRLAGRYPGADNIVGIDLSPYFIEVGKTLLDLAPSAFDDTKGSDDPHGWITAVDPDPRVELRQGDIARTGLPSNCVAAVNLGLVLHELPLSAAKEVAAEARRILRPGGQLWISEMDFESPAYRAQRENALLFSLLRATEPYLDEYADGVRELRECIAEMFDEVRIASATGRHYALVAVKGTDGGNEGPRKWARIDDRRFLPDGEYAIEDTHLKPWESKQNS
ncbi:hypothetical protein ACHAWF_011196 [Thalassiosira exigua]